MRLAGRRAVVTGSASGIGRAAAVLFGVEGATVVGADADGEGNAETARLVAEDGGTFVWAPPVDLTDEPAVRAWMDSVAAEVGGVDILFAAAGATRFAPVADLDYADWDFVLRHELDVVFLPVKHAWPHLVRAEAAAIVLVGSTAGVTGSMTNPRVAHTVAKGGIVALARQLAAEGAPAGIRANCVSPGLIRTPATEQDLLAPGSGMAGVHRSIPMGRFGRPEEVARAALFLASEEASYITGANLMVDGGWSAVLPGAPS